MNKTIQELLILAETYKMELPVRKPVDMTQLGNLGQYLDSTVLKPDALPAQVDQLCADAVEYKMKAVCVNPVFIGQIVRALRGTGVQACTVVGFPLGAVPTATKVFETRKAVQQGAQEIDMVIPVGLLKSGHYELVFDDVRGVVEEAHAGGALVKVIHENALLTQFEKIIACLISQAAGADFVKTSTGFAASGATADDVDLMRSVVGPVESMGVKAAGGIRSLADAYAMLKAGANRLGTSAGVKIMQEFQAEQNV